MAAFPVYFAAAIALHKTFKIVIYIIGDKVPNFTPVSHCMQVSITGNTSFSQIRIMQIEHILHLLKLFKHVV